MNIPSDIILTNQEVMPEMLKWTPEKHSFVTYFCRNVHFGNFDSKLTISGNSKTWRYWSTAYFWQTIAPSIQTGQARKPQCLRVRSWKSHCIRVYNLDLFLFRNTFIFTNYNEKFKNSKGTKGYMVLKAMSNMQNGKHDIQTAIRPSYFLILKLRQQEHKHTIYYSSDFVLCSCQWDTSMFQPDRKEFFKNLPWKKKTSSEILLSFTWCGDGKYHHKKKVSPKPFWLSG